MELLSCTDALLQETRKKLWRKINTKILQFSSQDAHSAVSISTLGHKEMVQTAKSINENLSISFHQIIGTEPRTNRSLLSSSQVNVDQIEQKKQQAKFD